MDRLGQIRATRPVFRVRVKHENLRHGLPTGVHASGDPDASGVGGRRDLGQGDRRIRPADPTDLARHDGPSGITRKSDVPIRIADDEPRQQRGRRDERDE